MKFTFKREHRITGLAGVGYPHQDVQIKLNKKIVGRIDAPNWQTSDDLWSVRFMVGDIENWKWVTLKQRFEDAEVAKQYLLRHQERIQRQSLISIED